MRIHLRCGAVVGILLGLCLAANAQVAEITTDQAFGKLRADLDSAYRNFPDDPLARSLIENAAVTGFQYRLSFVTIASLRYDTNFHQLLDRLAVCRFYDLAERESTRRHLAMAAHDLHSRSLPYLDDLDRPIGVLECYERLLDGLRTIRSRFQNHPDLRQIAETSISESFNTQLSYTRGLEDVDYVAEFTSRMKRIEREFGPATAAERQRNPGLAEAKDRNRNAYDLARSALQSVLSRVVQEFQ